MSIELPLEKMTLADKLEVMEALWADPARRLAILREAISRASHSRDGSWLQ